MQKKVKLETNIKKIPISTHIPNVSIFETRELWIQGPNNGKLGRYFQQKIILQVPTFVSILFIN